MKHKYSAVCMLLLSLATILLLRIPTILPAVYAEEYQGVLDLQLNDD